jgi:ribonuclease-3
VTRQVLENILGFKVVDPGKYASVFIHKSAHKRDGPDSYERYEFFGDSILNFIVSSYLFDKYPDADEGFLTRVRTKLVSRSRLSDLADKLGLHHYVVMNAKAMREGWNANPRIREDVFEALVCAVFKDLGMTMAKIFVLGVIERYVNFDEVVIDTNYKDILMRYAQTRCMDLPVYTVVNSPASTKTFDIVVIVSGRLHGRAQDKCKKVAEQEAARQAVTFLGLI